MVYPPVPMALPGFRRPIAPPAAAPSNGNPLSFIFGGNAPAKTPEDVARLRQIAQALDANATTPTSLGTGIDAIGKALLANKYSSDAQAGEDAGNAQASTDWNALLADGGTGDKSAILKALADPYLNQGQQGVASSLYTQSIAPKTQVINDKLVDSNGKVIGDYSDGPAWRPMTPAERSTYGVDTSDKAAYQVNTKTGEFKRTGNSSGATVNINPDAAGSALDKSLATQEGKSWSSYLDAGAAAQKMGGDMGVLQELVNGGAPQDPLTGPLLQMFPGIDSRAAAFQSIVKRIAPTMRATGSGSTSDVEYNGFLQSLPSLSNKPAANAVILQVLQNKAQIDLQRSQIVTDYLNSPQDGDAKKAARTALQALNKQSIVTPELRAQLTTMGVNVDAADSANQPPPGAAPTGSTADGDYTILDEGQ